MAFSKLQSTHNTATGATLSVPLGSNVTAGSLLFAAIRLGANASTATVSDNNSNNWARIGTALDPGATAGDTLDVWYAYNAVGGATTLTITPSYGAAHSTRYIVQEWSGVATVSPHDQDGTQNNTGVGTSTATPATTGTTAVASELALCVVMTDSANTYSVGGSWAIEDIEVNTAGSNRVGVESLTTGTAGSTITGSWSFTATTNAARIVTFKPFVAVAFTFQQLTENQIPADYLARPEVAGY